MELTLSHITISLPYWSVILGSLTFAFIITFTVIPSIIKVSHAKGLFDTPDSRKSHTHAIPTLGGVAVFLGMILPTAIFGNQDFEHDLKYIIVGLLILFFVGIKDDILAISARKKLMSEIFAIGIIIFLGDIRISNFHGFFGINEISYLVSALFSMFVFIVIINGFNLIDGIDGLASGVGVVTMSTFGIWFILIDHFAYAAFCFSAVGALIAFFRFNVFSKKNKIFLGDTGSLIIGLIAAIFTIKFLETNLTNTIGTIGESAPAIAFGILIVPLIDTLRIFSIRIFAGVSPFTADRHHIHHKVVDLGYTHLQATLLMFSFNLFIIVLSILLSHLGNIKLLAFIIPLSVFLTAIPSTILRYRDRLYFTKIGLLGDKSWMIPVTISNLSRYSVGRKEFLDQTYLTEKSQKHSDLEPVLLETHLRYHVEEASIKREGELYLDGNTEPF